MNSNLFDEMNFQKAIDRTQLIQHLSEDRQDWEILTEDEYIHIRFPNGIEKKVMQQLIKNLGIPSIHYTTIINAKNQPESIGIICFGRFQI